MAGAGITAANAREILAATGVRALHASGAERAAPLAPPASLVTLEFVHAAARVAVPSRMVWRPPGGGVPMGSGGGAAAEEYIVREATCASVAGIAAALAVDSGAL